MSNLFGFFQLQKTIHKVFLLQIFKAGFVDGFALKKQLDLDSQKINADPQPWFKCLQKFENSCANLNEEYVWLFREDPGGLQMVHRVPAVQQAPDGVHGEERVPRPARTHQHGRGTLSHRTHEPLQSRYNREHLFQSYKE